MKLTVAILAWLIMCSAASAACSSVETESQCNATSGCVWAADRLHPNDFSCKEKQTVPSICALQTNRLTCEYKGCVWDSHLGCQAKS